MFLLAYYTKNKHFNRIFTIIVIVFNLTTIKIHIFVIINVFKDFQLLWNYFFIFILFLFYFYFIFILFLLVCFFIHRHTFNVSCLRFFKNLLYIIHLSVVECAPYFII
jgi:hypothetical protein